MPPYIHIVRVTARGKKEDVALECCQALFEPFDRGLAKEMAKFVQREDRRIVRLAGQLDDLLQLRQLLPLPKQLVGLFSRVAKGGLSLPPTLPKAR